MADKPSKKPSPKGKFIGTSMANDGLYLGPAAKASSKTKEVAKDTKSRPEK